jgi:ubiquinone/menaquinone biosynthesis C-methylase UbiE
VGSYCIARSLLDSPYLDPHVAEVYGRLAAPAQFAEPARALVAAVDPPEGSTVLDVGTGTGIVAAELGRAVGSHGRVIGIDPSIEMLRRGRGERVAVAQAPGLPFRGGTFAAATASFVLSHLDRYEQALADMAGVCRPGGRIGITAWGTAANPAGALWKTVAAAYVAADRLADEFRRVIPSEAPLSDAAHLELVLRRVGLAAVRAIRHEFTVNVSALHYVAMKNATVEGILLQRMLTPDRWDAFTREVADAFRREFGATVLYVRDFLVAIGSKPDC